VDSKLVILGNGVHSKVVYELAVLLGHKIFGFIDIYGNDRTSLGNLDDLNDISKTHKDLSYVIATGNNLKRKEISEMYPNLNYVKLIAPSAYISPSAKIGTGSVVLHKAVINTNAVIGNHTLINTGVIVEHDNSIGNFTHLSPGVTLGGTVKIGDLTHLGLNSTVRNNVSIGNSIVIGMGSAVINNIGEPGTYVGVPAKEIKEGEN
jgi:sugar O-acyltransferase (sialic acid O-acetyltransferase NeuD family)